MSQSAPVRQRAQSIRFHVALLGAALVSMATPLAATHAQSRPLKSGIDTSGFDKSIRPQDDFFRYVNGAWLKKTVIKGDASGAGAFNELSDISRDAMHSLFEAAAKPTPPGDKATAKQVKLANGASDIERKKIGDMYAAGQNLKANTLRA